MHTSIRLDVPIPQVTFFHFNQFCVGSMFIEVWNTGTMCWGYSLALFGSLGDDLVCVTVLLALGLEQSNTHSITPVTPRSQQQTVAGRLLQSQFVFLLRR